MKLLLCPISPLRINGQTVRVTGLLIAIMIALYVYTGLIYFVVAMSMDFFIRAFTPLPYSPLSWVASQLVKTFNLSGHPVDKAPKIFSARVGFLFTLAIIGLYVIWPSVSVMVALTLMSFALLEAVWGFCAGCLVYTYVVLPIFREA